VVQVSQVHIPDPKWDEVRQAVLDGDVLPGEAALALTNARNTAVVRMARVLERIHAATPDEVWAARRPEEVECS
jgi:hypothetical protein